MDDLIRITIVMEMLTANLITVNNCATRKYSRLKTVTVLLAFTFILTSFTHGIWEILGFNDGNASFALIGIVYLIPLSLLYKEKISYISSILFSAWLYTLIIFCVSVILARMSPIYPLTHKTVIIQTLLYLLTYYAFTFWIQKGLLFILRNIAKSSRYILQLVSLSWFFSIVIIHASLIYPGSKTLGAAVLLTIISNSILSYLLLFSMVLNQQKVKNLEDVIYTDSLTGLPNRDRLFKDLNVHIEKGLSFRLFFIDLDRFKQINDSYGHAVGDRYLICFSGELKSLLAETDQAYRMSGDEFVIISRAEDFSVLTGRLNVFPAKLTGLDIPFLGMSAGWADYPLEEQTPDSLISLADDRMYQKKPHGSR